SGRADRAPGRTWGERRRCPAPVGRCRLRFVGGLFSRGAVVPSPGERLLDVRPELAPGGAFRLGEASQLPAHTGEVAVPRPVWQRLPEPCAAPGGVLPRGLAELCQLSAQPAQGPPAEGGAPLVIERVGVLALAAASQRGGAGGRVAVSEVRVLRPPGL